MRMQYPIRVMNSLCEITSSKRIFASDYVAEGVPFYRGKEITEKHKGNVEVSTELFIKRDKFEEIKTKFGAPIAGDLLLTSVGTLGSPYVVRPGEEFYFKDGNLTWFRRFNGLSSTFLYYWLLSPSGRAELTKCTIGSSQSAYTIVLLKQMEIRLPPLAIQRRIVGILSAYDDLIENCERRIRVLDEMARALYREWFVLFRYPGHEKTPLVDSPAGRIPKGWAVRTLRDVCIRMESGGTPKRQRKEYWIDGSIDWFKTGDLKDKYLFEADERITEAALNESSAKLFPAGTILMAIYGATIGWLGILTRTASCNQAALGLVANDQVLGQRSLFLLLAELKQYFISIAQGAAQQNISKEKVAGTSVVIPPRQWSRQFEEYIDPFFAQIEVLERRVKNLRKTRDLLLPRLLSGQLPVEDLHEKQLEESP